MIRPLRIGTRGSPLALAQAAETRARLAAALGWDADEIETVVIRTSGDRIQDVALREVGGKELFTKEIEAALLEGCIDIAVHSSKDVETVMPDELCLAGALPREDVRDAFISPQALHPLSLTEGARVGTASLRRQALLLRMRPDLKIVLLRGNVGTRLRKLEAGEVDATLLASAGLRRLDLMDRATTLLEADVFPPAPGQGTICLQTHRDNADVREMIARINDPSSFHALQIERAYLTALGGSCHTPVAAHAREVNGDWHFRAVVLSEDGQTTFERSWEGRRADAIDVACKLGADVRVQAAGVIPLG